MDPYQVPESVKFESEKSSLWRVVNIVVAWLLWLVCVFYFLGVCVIRFYPKMFIAEALNPDASIWVTLSGFGVIALAFGVLWVRQLVWFKQKKDPKFGFLAYSLALYLVTFIAQAAPALPLFLEGSSGVLFQFGGLFTLGLIVWAFPRLPKRV